MRMTIQKAAKLMNVSEQFVRVGLQKGNLPFGYAVKMSSKWTYYIDSDKFKKETGLEEVIEDGTVSTSD